MSNPDNSAGDCSPNWRKRKRLICRNSGCRFTFATEFNRSRHETFYCLSSKENSAEFRNVVPSHNDLKLDECVCRYPSCLQSFSLKKKQN